MLDMKKLIVAEMVALGHGGGGTENIRLVRRGVELFDTMPLLDVGFGKIDSVLVSHVLVPPDVSSVLDLNTTRDFLHSPIRQKQGNGGANEVDDNEDFDSVGSLAMSRASAMEGTRSKGQSSYP